MSPATWREGSVDDGRFAPNGWMVGVVDVHGGRFRSLGVVTTPTAVRGTIFLDPTSRLRVDHIRCHEEEVDSDDDDDDEERWNRCVLPSPK